MHRRKALVVIARTIAAGAALSLGLPLIERKAHAGKKGEAQKMVENFKMPENDYNLSFVKGIIKKSMDKISDMKMGSAGYQSFKIKRIYLTSEKWFTAHVKMKPDKSSCKPGITITIKAKGKKGSWKIGIPFTRLAKRYKEKTGKTLEYVTAGINKNAGDVEIFIIPAKTFEDAEKGNIEAGTPMLIIPYKAKKGNFASGFGRNLHNIVKG